MANEKRLIDANALKREFSTIADRSNLDYIFIDVISDAIEDAPTVDAVEVVRCKDCKHYHWEQEPCHGKIIRYCDVLSREVWKEFFCSYGERRTDNG